LAKRTMQARWTAKSSRAICMASISIRSRSKSPNCRSG
jgi:hypothetical protein